ncbi:hypothetical protein [Leptospira sp. GIMC2001]|uniref:hypothetical protein n=1 Tax=Leptospira sp. GIMC2001 TaxID=1513297 RepID=UPI00234B38C0|nr:hypothetical protein [Leptospira sp. GIMC2001]WCL49752.1 hypothetical protein O4O04_02720 [Leptospira sp. GIMC2001]
MIVKQFLIVGASGEAGQSAIQAIRSLDKSAIIIGTTTGVNDIIGVDFTLHNVRADQSIVQLILSQMSKVGHEPEFEAIIYTPALGEVGIPIANTTKHALEESLAISYDPMILLEKKFEPKKMVAYSAFYWLDHTKSFYGAMGHVKRIMDEWAIAKPTSRKIVRAGTFFSQSVRGISIVLQRMMKKTNDPELLELKKAYESSNSKFLDFFLQYAWDHEKAAFSSNFPAIAYRPTKRDDLSRGLIAVLKGTSPITSVLGDWTWEENQLPVLPDWFTRI